jgi:hypothetical protein
MEYGQQRGSAGATGAAARDFAAQSQGLGGLVRLYATYAANIYAAGAAFRALSDAMNTANMVKGLDQIGASSGKALGSLSKRLVEATDGAVSLREAMTAVAQTSAAGMTSNNILKLGTVAQKASQALGVNMSDALSRLSRGITKIEPELLDELGIFVKVDMANEKYARSLGKSVSALTEFERRQAFANEVLDQANTKFGKIDIPTNPYDKLAASIKNLSTKALELINIGLGPIVKLLSESPTALAVALAGIGTILLKTALPAIAQFKESFKKAAQEALVNAASAASNIGGLKSTRDTAAQVEKEAEKSAEIAAIARQKAQDKFEKLRGGKALARSGGVSDILSKNIYDIGTEDVAALERAQKAAKGNKQLYNSYKEIIAVIKLAKEEEEKYQQAVSTRQTAEEKLNRITKEQRQQELKFKDLGKKAVISDIIQKATSSEEELGFFASIKQNLKSTIDGYRALGAARKGSQLEIPTKDGDVQKFDIAGLGKLDTLLGGLKLTFATAYSWATKLFGIIGKAGPILAIANIGFEILDSYMSGAQVQAEKFSKSMELLQGSIKNAGDTVTAIFNKKPSEIFSIESLQAQANALNDLSDSLKQTSQDFSGLLEAQNGWDRAKMNLQEFVDRTSKTVPIVGKLLNKITSFTFGKGARVEAANSLADTLVQAVNLATEGPAKDKIQSKLSEVIGFNISSLNTEELKTKLAELDPKILASKFAESSAVIEGFSKSLNNSASNLTSFKDSVGETVKQFDNLITSLAPTDLIGKLGSSLLDTSGKLTNALKDPQNSILALKEVVNNTKLISLLPPEFADRLLGIKDKVNDLAEQIGKVQKKIKDAEAELAAPSTSQDRKVTLTLDVTKAKKELNTLQSQSTAFVGDYAKSINTALFDKGIANLEASFKQASQEAALTVSKSYVSIFQQLGGKTARMEANIKRQEVNIQATLLEAQYENAKQLSINTNKLEMVALSNEILAKQKEYDKLSEGPDKTTAGAKLFDLITQLQTARLAKRIYEGKDPAAEAKKLRAGAEGSSGEDAATAASGFLSTTYGYKAQLARLAGQREAINIEEQFKKAIEDTEKTKNELLNRSIKTSETELKLINDQQAAAGVYNEQLLDRKFIEEQLIERLKAQQELNKLQTALEEAKKLKGKPGVFEDERALLEQKIQSDINLARKNSNAARKVADDKYYRDKLTGEQSLAKAERGREATTQQQLEQNKTIALSYREQELEYITKTSDIIQKYAILEQDSIARTKQQIEYDKEQFAIKQRTAEVAELRESAQLATDQLGVAGAAEINKQYQDANAKLEEQKRISEANNNLKVKGIELNTKAALEQERYNKLLETANTAGESLQNIFSGMGDAAARIGAGLADMTKAFVGFAAASERGAKALDNIAKDRDDTTKTDAQRAKYAEQYNEQLNKNTKDEITGTAQIIGSAKKMFKEKSAGYKILGTVEKALHIARLAMDAKELAGKIANVATELAVRLEAGLAWVAAKLGIESQITFAENAGFLSRMGTYVTQIFAKFTATLGPFGMAAAAAVVAALGLRGGKRAAFKPSIDQQIETQGTGTEYDKRGRKVSTAGGVFGDDSAKADSVRNALDVIRENSTESLLYDNKALAALEKMVMALDKTATSLYSIPGFVLSKDEATTSSKIGIGSTGLFTKEEVLGSTIKFSGSLDDLAAGVESTVNRIDRVNQQNTIRLFGMKLGSFGGQQDRQGTLSEEVRNNLQDVFTYGKELLQTVGEDVGRKVDTSALMATQSLTIKPGMTGEELQAEFTAVVSKQFNIWNEQAFPEFKKFRQFGEEYLETVVRVSATNKSANESIKNLGTATQRFGDLTYEASEALAKSFGGTQEFIAAFEAYGQSMFTEQEQLDRKRVSVAERLNKLGLQDIKTKTQYNTKVQQLIRDGQQNTETFEKLILLAPEFAEVVESVADRLENAQSALESAYSDLDSAGEVFRNIIKSLKDFKDSLQKTITTPGEQYIKAKARFEQLAIEAKTSPKAAQELANAGNVFAEASRTMFASSQAYVDDVGFINQAVDEVITINQNLLTPIEEQLNEARLQNIRLAEISGYTYTTKERINALITALQAAIPEVAAAKVAAEEVLPPPVKLSIQEKPEPTPGSYSDITSKLTATPTNIIDAFLGNLFGYASSGSIPTGTASSIYDLGGGNAYFETAATGSNYIKKDMPLFVHEGERIMPAADNRQLMKMVSDYSGGGNSELYDEVCRLTRQVEVLTQVVADGAIMNAKATDRNTDELATTIQNTSENTVYNQKLQNKVAVV